MYQLLKKTVKKKSVKHVGPLLTSILQHGQRRCQHRVAQLSVPLMYRLHNGLDAPPRTTVITVTPSDIEYFVYPGFFREYRISRVEGNNWDTKAETKDIRSHPSSAGRALFPIEEYDFYQSMREHFENGKRWSDTEFYSLAREKLKHNESWYHGCTTVDELNSRLNYVDELYKTIESDGYKSANELDRGYRHEVTVNITRDGEIVMDDGRHRLFIAKLLDLDAIPVWVHVRHRAWQQKRTEIYRAEDPTKLNGNLQQHLEHPDVPS